MAFNHGSVATLSLDGTDVSEYLHEVSLSRDIDTAETSALGTVAKTYVPGLTDATFTVSGMFDPTFVTLVDGFVASQVTSPIAFEFHPAGDGSGKPKYTGNCLMTSMEVGDSVDDMASLDLEFQITGAVTLGTQS